MAEEKILKDEILEDEQLEQVAGGTEQQTAETIKGLKELGVIPQSAEPHDEDLVRRALGAYGFDVEIHGGFADDNKYTCRSGELAGQSFGVTGALNIIRELQKRGEFHKVS